MNEVRQADLGTAPAKSTDSASTSIDGMPAVAAFLSLLERFSNRER